MTSSRLTALGLMALALLREGDMHPYEMIRLLRIRGDDRLVTLANGTFYHTVSRLEEQGFMAEVGVDRDGRRPERTTYSLTEAGRDVVADWVRHELPRIDRPADFRVALAEAHNLDRDEVLLLLRQHRDALIADAADYETGLMRAREGGVPDQYLIEIDRSTALHTADLRWLDALIERFEREDIPWGDDVEAPTHTYVAQRKAAQQ